MNDDELHKIPLTGRYVGNGDFSRSVIRSYHQNQVFFLLYS
ncbi:Uncharacterised protein [Buttiauxella agrestis]|uniref:Uncharacterized protein n=1 Tax=Buttiauxella agrestis TaxID=82977 RepID=A0A381KN88_9ENTR|nr:Uncharacterised protein [Buttiauxella agrestis]